MDGKRCRMAPSKPWPWEDGEFSEAGGRGAGAPAGGVIVKPLVDVHQVAPRQVVNVLDFLRESEVELCARVGIVEGLQHTLERRVAFRHGAHDRSDGHRTAYHVGHLGVLERLFGRRFHATYRLTQDQVEQLSSLVRVGRLRFLQRGLVGALQHSLRKVVLARHLRLQCGGRCGGKWAARRTCHPSFRMLPPAPPLPPFQVCPAPLFPLRGAPATRETCRATSCPPLPGLRKYQRSGATHRGLGARRRRKSRRVCCS